MSLVTSDWLENNLDKVKLIDCSWHMPNVKRNGYEEYLKEHIPGTIFFDLDKYSDANTDLPHMLPDPDTWEEIVSNLGISNNDRIIIYDNSDVLSSCRCRYNFIYFGHNPNLVSILDGVEIFSERIRNSCWAPPIATGEHIFLFGKKGESIYIIKENEK